MPLSNIPISTNPEVGKYNNIINVEEKSNLYLELVFKDKHFMPWMQNEKLHTDLLNGKYTHRNTCMLLSLIHWYYSGDRWSDYSQRTHNSQAKAECDKLLLKIVEEQEVSAKSAVLLCWLKQVMNVKLHCSLYRFVCSLLLQISYMLFNLNSFSCNHWAAFTTYIIIFFQFLTHSLTGAFTCNAETPPTPYLQMSKCFDQTDSDTSARLQAIKDRTETACVLKDKVCGPTCSQMECYRVISLRKWRYFVPWNEDFLCLFCPCLQ